MKKIIFILSVMSILLLTGCNLGSDKTIEENEDIIIEEPEQPEPQQPEPQVITKPINNDCYVNGYCVNGEIHATCPEDCIETCGDSIVQDGETIKNCRYDIMVVCGDGVCQEWEHYRYCSEDCEPCVVDDTNKYEGPNECPPSPRWEV